MQAWFPPYTTYTRIGGLGGPVSVGQYRSDFVGSGAGKQLWLQLPGGTNAGQHLVTITKPTSSATPFAYKADVWDSKFGVGTYDGNWNRCWICLFSGAAPTPEAAGTNVYFHGLENSNYIEILATGPSYGVFQNYAVASSYSANVKYLNVNAYSTVQNMSARAATRLDGSSLVPSSTTRDLGAPATFAGIAACVSSDEFLYISAIRRLPLNTYP